MLFKYNADGSLDLYFQNESPGAGKEANWLAAPKGAFNLAMRLYAPKQDALTHRVHNETLSVAAMCVCNPDRSPVGINR